jgi:hypothetical protein
MSNIVHRPSAAALVTAGIALIALASQAAQAQTAAPATTTATSTTTSTATTVHHYHRSYHRQSADDTLTAQLNHQELVRMTNSETMTATITNVTSYNYGHQALPSGASPISDLALYP